MGEMEVQMRCRGFRQRCRLVNSLVGFRGVYLPLLPGFVDDFLEVSQGFAWLYEGCLGRFFHTQEVPEDSRCVLSCSKRGPCMAIDRLKVQVQVVGVVVGVLVLVRLLGGGGAAAVDAVAACLLCCRCGRLVLI